LLLLLLLLLLFFFSSSCSGDLFKNVYGINRNTFVTEIGHRLSKLHNGGDDNDDGDDHSLLLLD